MTTMKLAILLGAALTVGSATQASLSPRAAAPQAGQQKAETESDRTGARNAENGEGERTGARNADNGEGDRTGARNVSSSGERLRAHHASGGVALLWL